MLIQASTLFLEVTEEILRRGSRVRFVAEGTSMHPTLRAGDALWVAPVDPAAVRSLDILLYRGPRGPIAHRVRRIRNAPGRLTAFLLQGDAPGAGGEWVDPSQILGRVVAVERGDRTMALSGSWSLSRQRLGVALHRLKRWMSVCL